MFATCKELNIPPHLFFNPAVYDAELQWQCIGFYSYMKAEEQKAAAKGNNHFDTIPK